MQKAGLSHMVFEVGAEPGLPASSLLFIFLVYTQQPLCPLPFFSVLSFVQTIYLMWLAPTTEPLILWSP